MIKLLIVDDSPFMQKSLKRLFAENDGIEVVGMAADAYEAREKIVALRPDVITLDIELPRMNGLDFLKKIMAHYPLPVIVVSSISPAGSDNAIRALELGAVDVISKPACKEAVQEFALILREKIRDAKHAHIRQHSEEANPAGPAVAGLTDAEMKGKILAIGASTGGTEAIASVLQVLPKNTPGTVMVQHMPAYITPAFAKRLDSLSALEVHEARTGEILRPGLALLAPGDKHVVVTKKENDYMVHLKDGPRVYHQRPSVEVLFDSVAKWGGKDAVGVILTGMGMDGAKAMLNMRNNGAYTIAQDEKTSVVFGMPKAAIDLEAAVTVMPLEKVPLGIIQGFKKLCGAKAPKASGEGLNRG